jgi:glycine cleavage system transcriptional repressor
MTLIVSAAVEPMEIEAALDEVARSMSLLVSVRTVPREHSGASDGAHHVLTVHGGDRPGIVSAITDVIARRGGNITDLTTRLAGVFYVLVAEVDLPADADFDALESELAQVAGGLGVEASLRAADADVL